jgi:hypothetical protein
VLVIAQGPARLFALSMRTHAGLPGAFFRRRQCLPKVAAALAALALTAARPDAEACLEPDGSNDADYRNYGTQFQGTLLSFKIVVPGVGTGARNTSAFRLNQNWGISTAHNVTDLLQFHPTYEIGTGDNYMTNRGTVVTVDRIIIHPQYNGDSHSSPDLVLLHFASCLPGHDSNVASCSSDEIVGSSGFGVTGTPSTGTVPRDGCSRAWNAKVFGSMAPTGYSGEFYYGANFQPNAGVLLNGKGLSGDSGGCVRKTSGELVGVIVADLGGLTANGLQIFARLDAVRTWIEEVTAEPRLRIQNLQTNTVLLAWPTNAGGFALQDNETLASTNWTTVTNSPVVVSNEFQVNLPTTFPKSFYRLVLP